MRNYMRLAKDMQRETHGVTPEEELRKALGISNVGYTPRNEHGHSGLAIDGRINEYLHSLQKAYA
jgi:hypothetical protein